jgi:hypothetical protein
MYHSYRRERVEDITRVLRGWVFRTAKAIQTGAKGYVPRATSTLARAIGVAFINNGLIGIIAINAPYARYVEGYPEATRRHFHSWEHDPQFRAWARRRGFDTSRAKGGLLVWGYNIPFFRAAISDVRPKAQAELHRLRI